MPRLTNYNDSGWGSDSGFIPSGMQSRTDAQGRLRQALDNGGAGGGGIPVGGGGSAALPSTPIANATGTIAGAVPTGMAAGTGSSMWAALLPLIMSAVGYFGSKASGGGGGSVAGGADIAALLKQFPQLGEALQLQTDQAKRQDPLHAALTQLGMNLLPRTAFSALPRTGMVPSYLQSHTLPNAQAPGAGGGAPLKPPTPPLPDPYPEGNGRPRV